MISFNKCFKISSWLDRYDTILPCKNDLQFNIWIPDKMIFESSSYGKQYFDGLSSVVWNLVLLVYYGCIMADNDTNDRLCDQLWHWPGIIMIFPNSNSFIYWLVSWGQFGNFIGWLSQVDRVLNMTIFMYCGQRIIWWYVG